MQILMEERETVLRTMESSFYRQADKEEDKEAEEYRESYELFCSETCGHYHSIRCTQDEIQPLLIPYLKAYAQGRDLALALLIGSEIELTAAERLSKAAHACSCVTPMIMQTSTAYRDANKQIIIYLAKVDSAKNNSYSWDTVLDIITAQMRVNRC